MTEDETFTALKKWSYSEMCAVLYGKGFVPEEDFYISRGWTIAEFYHERYIRRIINDDRR